MRIDAYASEQYRRADESTQSANVAGRTTPQASVTTTSFGFRLGGFGLDYESERTVLDPSLTRTAMDRDAAAYRTEQQIGSLRAQVGAEGADYRDRSASSAATTSSYRLKSGLAAYARSAEDSLPLPGSMLAAVI